MRHANLNIVLGPPGTGKTTWLLKLVEDALENGVPPQKIAFLTFTKQAANEAKKRATDRFALGPDDFPWFRTIHSLVFRQLGLNKQQIVTAANFEELGKLLGIEFQGNSTLDEDGVVVVGAKGDKMVFLENLARATHASLRETWEKQDHGTGHDANRGVSFEELDMFARAYAKFKFSRGLLDYTDMLQLFAATGTAPRIDILIIDEAQDLSAAQWAVAAAVATTASVVYAAGDDDQAIYRWAGADVEQFLRLAGRVHVLDQSYRIPEVVHTVATSLTARILQRRSKMFRPRDVRGTVRHVVDIDEVDMSSGSWLLLTRHVYQMSAYEQACRENGWSYAIRGRSFANSASVRAIMAWEALRRGESVAVGAIAEAYRRMRAGVTAAGRSALSRRDATETASLADLTTNFGLSTNRIWHEAFDAMPYAEKNFYIRARKQGERLTGEPRIRISTIHGAKGGQAEHVVLTTDISEMADAAMRRDADDETRVWYVGATRAQKSLTLVQPRTRLFFEV